MHMFKDTEYNAFAGEKMGSYHFPALWLAGQIINELENS